MKVAQFHRLGNTDRHTLRVWAKKICSPVLFSSYFSDISLTEIQKNIVLLCKKCCNATFHLIIKQLKASWGIHLKTHSSYWMATVSVQSESGYCVIISKTEKLSICPFYFSTYTMKIFYFWSTTKKVALAFAWLVNVHTATTKWKPTLNCMNIARL